MTLGIDIGGTNVSLGLVRQGVLQHAFSAPSFPPEASLEQTLESLCGHIRRIITPDTRKIGIGVPSVVDVKEGIVYDTQNIPSWKEVPLKAFLEERFQIPVAVNNDANCYALGIYAQYPATARPELLVAITLGTGVGMGIVEEGRLFCGANCGAGELGSLPYRDALIEDFCGRHFFERNNWDSWRLLRRPGRGIPKPWLFSTNWAATWAPCSAPSSLPMIRATSLSAAASPTTMTGSAARWKRTCGSISRTERRSSA